MIDKEFELQICQLPGGAILPCSEPDKLRRRQNLLYNPWEKRVRPSDETIDKIVAEVQDADQSYGPADVDNLIKVASFREWELNTYSYVLSIRNYKFLIQCCSLIFEHFPTCCLSIFEDKFEKNA